MWMGSLDLWWQVVNRTSNAQIYRFLTTLHCMTKCRFTSKSVFILLWLQYCFYLSHSGRNFIFGLNDLLQITKASRHYYLWYFVLFWTLPKIFRTCSPCLAHLFLTRYAPHSICFVYGNWSNKANLAIECVPWTFCRFSSRVSGLQEIYTTLSNFWRSWRVSSSSPERGGSTYIETDNKYTHYFSTLPLSWELWGFNEIDLQNHDWAMSKQALHGPWCIPKMRNHMPQLKLTL